MHSGGRSLRDSYTVLTHLQTHLNVFLYVFSHSGSHIVSMVCEKSSVDNVMRRYDANQVDRTLSEGDKSVDQRDKEDQSQNPLTGG